MYQFLSSLGIASTEAATAYTLLVGVYEKAQRGRTGMETLSKLKGVITSGEISGDLRARRNELYRLMRELQERKKLQQHEGLKRLNSNSALGLDGFSAKFFKRFSGVFEP